MLESSIVLDLLFALFVYLFLYLVQDLQILTTWVQFLMMVLFSGSHALGLQAHALGPVSVTVTVHLGDRTHMAYWD